MSEIFFRNIEETDLEEVSSLLNQLKKIDLNKIDYKEAWSNFISNTGSNSIVGVYDKKIVAYGSIVVENKIRGCLLYTSPSPRDCLLSRMPSSA